MSLEVQWLRLHTPNAGGPGSILARELDLTCRNKDGRSHMSQLRPSTVEYIIKKKNEMQEPLPLFNTFILLGRCMQCSPLRLFLISFVFPSEILSIYLGTVVHWSSSYSLASLSYTYSTIHVTIESTGSSHGSKVSPRVKEAAWSYLLLASPRQHVLV